MSPATIRRRDVALAGAALLLLGGCRKELPMAPSTLDRGIVVYEHANYLGESAHLVRDVKDLKAFKGPCIEFESSGPGVTGTTDHWNDCISSIQVAPGWRATLYRDDDFKGDRLETGENHSNLQLAPGRCDKGGFNDCTTSIRVIPP